jgi:3-oxoacyl-[acyl-carrier-protein] synthase II
MDISARGGVRTAVSACASSTEAIANAYNRLQTGEVDIVVAGGCEAAIHALPVSAFAAMHALSKRNDDPARASRPYDSNRDGFVMGEGGATLVLETEEHALARGA